ncbi:MAG: DsrE family protein [Acidobacteriota bacterium]
MAEYLLISSRDPFETSTAEEFHMLASRLASHGDRVTLFLVQNGVLPARCCPRSQSLERAAESGVEILADAFSLRERGIAGNRLTRGVQPAPLATIIDQLAAGRKALWHCERERETAHHG